MSQSTPSGIRVNLRTLNACLLFAVVCGAVTYFLTMNDLSTRGFVFKDLKQKANDLAAEQQRMEGEVTALASYQNLNPRIQTLSLVAADTVHYISWDSRLVAKK